MTTGFIGAGKVGFSLGKFFARGGLPMTGYYSRHRESAREAALFTGTRPYDGLGALIQDSDALFLTVPDGEIASVFQQLRQFELTGKQICHCSGAMTAREAFPGIGQTGAYGYSIHPLFPISSKREAYRELAGAFFCLEGEGPHLEQWARRLRELGPQVQVLPPDCKVRYHAACAAASNLVCALAQMSLELLEGGGAVAPQIKAIVDSGIPVCAHIGMTPQSVNAFGGFKVQGKGEANARRVLEDAFAVQEAGAFMAVLECVPPKLAALITKKTRLITIGIGGGAGCDGQILVYQDMLAMGGDFVPKFVKQFGQIGQAMTEAFRAYDAEVKAGTFPTEAHAFVKSDCSDEFLAQLDRDY